MDFVYKHDGANCKGEVKLSRPTFDQRWQYIEECGFKTDEKGEISAGIAQAGAIRRMVSVSEKHYKEVKIEKKSEPVVYTSFSELSLDPECDEVLIAVASKIMNGGKPGKN